MISFLFKVVLSYLLGSVVGSLAIRPFMGGVDIRSMGSGNAGATNALRTLGKKVGLIVFAIDVAKGWIATALIASWNVPLLPAEGHLWDWTPAACGIAVMLGHVYPVWYGFRGGKGMATLIGAVLGMSVRLVIPMLLTFLITVMIFGFVSLGSMAGTAALLFTALLEHRGAPLVSFAVAALALVLYTHRANIGRMLKGSESRAKRLWLVGLVRSQG
jgi:acyl phosphate:glycerol-3-phosphate acyltransferase